MAGKSVVVAILADTKKFTSGMGDAVRSADGFGGALANMGKVAGVAMAALGSAAVAGTVAATKLYSEYEQLAGGVTKLFGDADRTVEEFARNAARTAGLSTNQYLETVTSFSASLIAGLKGDQAAAARVADMAIIDMADNANTFGTSLESIQTAYQGFAKQNYTMLDNLKLGYGGTAAEMARLINESGVLGGSFKATAQNVKDIPFDKVIEAIHRIQEGMNIAGTTSREAAATIQGAFLATRASITNLTLGFAQTDADFEALTADLVTNATNLVTNIIPVVGRIASAVQVMIPMIVQTILDSLPDLMSAADGIAGTLTGAVRRAADWLANGGVFTIVTAFLNGRDAMFSAAEKVFPAIIEALVSLVPEIARSVIQLVSSLSVVLISSLPILLDGAVQLFLALAQGAVKVLPMLVMQLTAVVVNLVLTLVDMVPVLLDGAIQLFTSLIDAVVTILPSLLEQIVAMLPIILESLVGLIPQLLEGAISLFMAIVKAIPVILPVLIDALVGLIPVLIETLLSLIPELLTAGIDLFFALVDALPVILPALIDAVIMLFPKVIEALINAGPQLGDAAGKAFSKITDAVTSIGPKLLQAGKDLVQGLWNGITSVWNNFQKWWNRTVGGVVDTVKNVLGIKSPSRVFAGIGVDVVRGLEQGLARPNRLDSLMGGLAGDLQSSFSADLNAPAGYRTAGGATTVVVQLPVGMPSADAGREIVRALEEYERAGGTIHLGGVA